MSRPAYMDEPWFGLLEREVRASSMAAAARRVGVTRAAVSYVMNGAGAYGSGAASTAKFARRVLVALSTIECPFLSATAGEPRLICGDVCRGYAYREVPTGSALATRHWRACRECERRVPPPRGWDEQRRIFTDLKFERLAQPRRAKPDVAASNNLEEAQL